MSLFKIEVHSVISTFERRSPPSVLAAIGNPPHFLAIFRPIASRVVFVLWGNLSLPNACFESKVQQSSFDRSSNLCIGNVCATSATFSWRVVIITMLPGFPSMKGLTSAIQSL
ncbi:hypothetical protein MtrunA17_Chr3g0089491 [Medicago truncatula]|uniref:Uncharacterized protein n=1 Tax=Medicago truncatula TaxID=3880 RepID=A0A396IM06_MEDTR|nr:hypothetical protein MtrunA17_Chr3g0089491 [Medicago truncatula]